MRYIGRRLDISSHNYRKVANNNHQHYYESNSPIFKNVCVQETLNFSKPTNLHFKSGEVFGLKILDGIFSFLLG